MKVRIERKYWPSQAKSDNDALDVGTVVDLPDKEAIRLVDDGIARLVLEEKKS